MDSNLSRAEPGTGRITGKVLGRGFTYVSANGRRSISERTRQRIEDLAIPPAWTEVWISFKSTARIQATGTDAAARIQYIYHAHRRAPRDGEEFIRSLAFAQRRPTLRRIVTRDLAQAKDGKRRAVAAAVRIMDSTGLRVGGAPYAEEHGPLVRARCASAISPFRETRSG